MIPVLRKLFPNARIVLKYSNNWELLVTVELSAQCTDKKVNEVTEKLFKKYRSLSDYFVADQKIFEYDIKSTGFYHNKSCRVSCSGLRSSSASWRTAGLKAKNILAAAKMVSEKFGGEIPRTMAEILTVPGVARKTANVVLGNAYGVVEGIAVDTHVLRFAQKFDLSDFKDAVKVERDLMDIVPREFWFSWTYWLIEYGRQICPARAHECGDHPLTKIYPRAASIWPKK